MPPVIDTPSLSLLQECAPISYPGIQGAGCPLLGPIGPQCPGLQDRAVFLALIPHSSH